MLSRFTTEPGYLLSRFTAEPGYLEPAHPLSLALGFESSHNVKDHHYIMCRLNEEF